MTVRTHYVSKVGEQKLSQHFKVKEFQSKDGVDKVLIDTDLVSILQKIRSHFNRPVTILSAYRTPTHNANIGGSSTSYHVKGMAADIQVKGVDPILVGLYAESLGVGGVGVYAYNGGFVHIDTRPTKYRWLTIDRGAKYEAIPKVMPTIKQGGIYNTTNSTKLVQRKLGVSQSGTFGDLTNKAVKNFQRENGLSVDGIVGKNTWTRLFA